MDDSSLSITTFAGRDGMKALFADWERLMTRISNQCFYHQPQWFSAYLGRRDEDDTSIVFVAVYRGPELVAVFPTRWQRVRRNGMLEVSLPVGEELYQADCAIGDGENAAAIYSLYRRNLADIVGERWDYYRANDVLEGSGLNRAMTMDGGFSRTIVVDKRCAEIAITDYESALRALSKKFRGNLNNARSKLGRAGNAKFSVARDPVAIESAFRQFVDLEMAGWKGNPENPRDNYPRPSAIGLKDRKHRFYASVVQQMAATGRVEISTLTLDEHVIGAQICFLLNETSYMLKVAYNEEFGRFSPGHMMIDYAYQRYADEGRIRRCNLITDYDWFAGWNPQYRHYLVMRDFNATLRGTVACLRSKFGARTRSNARTATTGMAAP